MKPAHLLLAVSIAAVWGINFVVIDLGLGQFPPLLFSAFRFVLCAIPAVFFIGGPRVQWRWVFAVGILLGFFMFGFMFLAMYAGMPAGLTSLVMQSHVLFTVLFAAVLLREHPGRRKLIGTFIGAIGIAVIAVEYGTSSPFLAFGLVILAAAFWGLSNIASRKAQAPDMFRFMVWVSTIPPLPLIVLSALAEGVDRDLAALSNINLTGWGTALYVSWISTLFGFGAWGYLLRLYDASSVAPYSLLVPVFGMSSAAVALAEIPTVVEVLGSVLVIAGVAITAVAPKKRQTAPVALEAPLAGTETAAVPVFGKNNGKGEQA